VASARQDGPELITIWGEQTAVRILHQAGFNNISVNHLEADFVPGTAPSAEGARSEPGPSITSRSWTPARRRGWRRRPHHHRVGQLAAVPDEASRPAIGASGPAFRVIRQGRGSGMGSEGRTARPRAIRWRPRRASRRSRPSRDGWGSSVSVTTGRPVYPWSKQTARSSS
jgi:hypothetical protein